MKTRSASSVSSQLASLLRSTVNEPTSENVHRLRTNTRRIQTFAQTKSRLPRGSKAVLKDLHRIFKKAGKVRDLDVQIEALASVKVASVVRDRGRVTRALEKARTRKSEKLIAEIEKLTSNGLLDSLNHLATELSAAGNEADPAEILQRARHQFHKINREFPKLSADNLHQYRICCKHVRYLAETAASLPDAVDLIESLKQIQDVIGVWHDWAVLAERAEKTLSHPSHRPLVSILRTRVQNKLTEALRVATRTRDALSKHDKQEREDLRRKPSSSVKSVRDSANMIA